MGLDPVSCDSGSCGSDWHRGFEWGLPKFVPPMMALSVGEEVAEVVEGEGGRETFLTEDLLGEQVLRFLQ